MAGLVLVVSLTLAQVLEMYRRIMVQSGGRMGVLSMPAIESALAQPRMTFGGRDLYPTTIAKAAALGFSIVRDHPFVDGNKRVGHAAMEMFLALNGYQLDAPVDEQVDLMLHLA
jgi:death-on-curing protein